MLFAVLFLHVHVLHAVYGLNVHIGVACAHVGMQCAVWGPIEANEAVGRCYVCAMALFACWYLQRLLVAACCANLSASWTCVAQICLLIL